MQQFRQTQHRSVEKDNSGKELSDLKRQVKLLERKNKRLMKELSKAVDVRHGFEAEEDEMPEAEAPSQPTKHANCPKCTQGLRELHLDTPGGTKHFVVCGDCGYRSVVL